VKNIHFLSPTSNVNSQGLRDWRMETPLTVENGAAAAGNSNLLPFDSNRLDGTASSSSHITVFPVQTLRRLLLISVSVVLSEIIQFICQVCLIMQSRRLSVSAISAVLVIWTLLALTLTAQWVILLSSNRVAMYTTYPINNFATQISIQCQPITNFFSINWRRVKRGKMLICGCQGLAVLSLLASIALLSVQYEVNKWKGLTSR
jgi:hypothetical protein